MSDDREIRMEPPDPDELAAAPGPDEPKPRVVIEYRNRTFPSSFWVPLLIVALAGVIIGLRLRTVDWPGLAIFQQPVPVVVHEQPEPPQVRAGTLPVPPPRIVIADATRPAAAPATPAPAPAAPPAAAPEKKIEPTKAEAKAEAAPRPEPAPEQPEPPAPSAPARSLSPADFGAPLAVGFDPPATIHPESKPEEEPGAKAPPAPPRPPEKEVTKEQIWNDIAREAAEADAQRRQIEQMAPVWLQQDRQEAERRQAEHDAETRRRTEEDRASFRAELQRILTRRGVQADDIYDLCERFGRDTVPEVEDNARRIIEQSKARVSRRDLTRMLRNCGLPETRILDYLAHAEKKNILARNGPRNEDEAMIRAARALLAVPLPVRPAPRAAPAGNGNAPAARPVTAGPAATPVPAPAAARVP